MQPEWKLTCAFSKKAAAAEGASTLETVATNAVFNEVKAQRMVINGVDVLDKLRELQAKVDRLEAAPSDLAHERPQADVAEWMERLNPQESMVAGDLVECRSQRITKTITGLPGSTLFVISTDPFLTGHAQPENIRHLFERVAMLGRVPVRVVGECPNNAFLVPSGESDGLARADTDFGSDAARTGAWDRRVHGARAGERGSRRQAGRHLGVRRVPVRSIDCGAGVQGWGCS